MQVILFVFLSRRMHIILQKESTNFLGYTPELSIEACSKSMSTTCSSPVHIISLLSCLCYLSRWIKMYILSLKLRCSF